MKLWIVTALVLVASLLPAIPVQADAPAGVLVATGRTSPGVTVSLYAWPSSRVLRHQQAGQAVPRKLLASTTVGPGATYSLRVPRAELAAAVVSGGYDNLEIDVGATSWFFTENAARPAVITRQLSASPQATCTNWTLYRGLKKAWGTVGQSYVGRGARGTTQSFTYEAGQSSTLGVGESVSTPAGGFTNAGTVSVSTTAEQGFPTFGVANVNYRTEFKMAEYTQTCTPVAKITPGALATMPTAKKSCNPIINDCTYFQVKPVEWAGGGTWKLPRSAPTSGFCVVEKRGDSFRTHTEKAVTWSGGLDVLQVGFNASAQTGYDNSAEVSFKFNGRETVQLCGTNNFPPEAGQVVARA
jgi:hypothetical protein